MMNSYELRCSTSPSSITDVHDFLDRHLARFVDDDEWLPDLHVVVDELISNIEKYAYGGRPGEYLVRITVSDGPLEIVMEDQGREFDPTMVDERPIEGDYDRPVGHLGLLLVKNMVDSIDYSRREGRNVTTIAVSVPIRKNLKEYADDV